MERPFVALNLEMLESATHWLAEQDESMARVFERYGYPPLWAREASFSTLVHIILEQQVSLASANAAFAKLSTRMAGQVDPEDFLLLPEAALQADGFSRQKIRYARILAERMVMEPLFLEKMHEMPDETAKNHLTQLTGIGHWTADIYLSECLLRPNILPRGDIALNEAFRQLKNLESRPEYPVLEKMTEKWRPWRSVGIRLLWHYYLCRRAEK